jgi:hypothetical protein
MYIKGDDPSINDIDAIYRNICQVFFEVVQIFIRTNMVHLSTYNLFHSTSDCTEKHYNILSTKF